MERRKVILGWALFDVANSSYTTIIITVAFNVIFSQIIVAGGLNSDFSRGNFLWSVVLSCSWVLTAATGPLFGVISDRTGGKKKMLALSVLLCAGATAFLYFVSPGDIALAAFLLIVSNFGFSLSENFIAAFLPHITTPENMGKISGLGWGLGYLGGLLSVILVGGIVGFHFEINRYESLRWTGPLTAAFFLLFSIPTFLWVPEPKTAGSETVGARRAYRDLFRTFLSLRDYPVLRRFLLSFFFFQAGLSIVISFAALYGQQEVGIKGAMFTIFFVTLQLSAGLGAVFFGRVQDRLGAFPTLNLTLYIWVVTIFLIAGLSPIASALGGRIEILFIVFSNLAGLCLGATQASARAIVGLLSPSERSGEFFGFWGLSGKLAAVAGVLVFGLLQQLFTLRAAMLACSAFFVLGLILNHTATSMHSSRP